MKKLFILLSMPMVAMMLTSCLTTLLTVAAVSDAEPHRPQPVVIEPVRQQVAVPVYTTTTVRTPGQVTTTTTISVSQFSRDWCLSLDLQAVGAAFAQSSSVEEFERILNSPRYMISNLDLNGDGFIDYIRVMETFSGFNHAFVLQAVLAPNVFQNVATIIVELNYATPYCQIIGEPYLYGPQYVVQPLYVRTPAIYSYFARPVYEPWHSPYYWDHFPTYYAHPAPQHLTHYQAYIETYIHGSHYCHEVSYPSAPHFTAYESFCISISHNDYQRQHPEQGFSQRTSGMTYEADNVTRSVRNASDVRQAVAATTTRTSSSRSAATQSQATQQSSSRSTTSSTNTTATSSRQTTTPTPAQQTTTTSTRQGSTTTTPTRQTTSQTTTTTRQASTSTTSRIKSDGTVRSTRTTTTQGSATSTSRSASAGTSSRSSSTNTTTTPRR